MEVTNAKSRAVCAWGWGLQVRVSLGSGLALHAPGTDGAPEPWKRGWSSPCMHPEDEAGPDAPCGVQRQSLWGWGAGTARLSQLGEVHLTHWVLGETLLRLRGWAQGRDHTLEAVPVT